MVWSRGREPTTTRVPATSASRSHKPRLILAMLPSTPASYLTSKLYALFSNNSDFSGQFEFFGTTYLLHLKICVSNSFCTLETNLYVPELAFRLELYTRDLLLNENSDWFLYSKIPKTKWLSLTLRGFVFRFQLKSGFRQSLQNKSEGNSSAFHLALQRPLFSIFRSMWKVRFVFPITLWSPPSYVPGRFIGLGLRRAKRARKSAPDFAAKL